MPRIYGKNPEHSKRMMGNNNALGNISNTGKKLIISEAGKIAKINHINRVNSQGFENKGGRCKFYEFNGLIIQGRYELYYIINNPNLQKCKPIRTPLGFYTPDFFDGEKYIEIKSSYTIKTCLNGLQFKKIKWVSKNVNKVQIIVLKENIVFEFFKLEDIEQYVKTC